MSLFTHYANSTTFKCLALACVLAGCTQQSQNLNAMAKEVFFGIPDVDLTPEQIDAIPYATQYVKINDAQMILVALAFAEANPQTGIMQLKWVSADRTMIVTENGVIVKTLRLPTGNVQRELAAHPIWQDGINWQSHFNWPDTSQYGFSATSALTRLETQQVTTPLWQQTLTHWQEKITVPLLNQSFTNDYWVNANGDVLKSVQYLGPEMTKIEMESAKYFNGQLSGATAQ